jgi:hypothetical protein
LRLTSRWNCRFGLERSGGSSAVAEKQQEVRGAGQPSPVTRRPEKAPARATLSHKRERETSKTQEATARRANDAAVFWPYFCALAFSRGAVALFLHTLAGDLSGSFCSTLQRRHSFCDNGFHRGFLLGRTINQRRPHFSCCFAHSPQSGLNQRHGITFPAVA